MWQFYDTLSLYITDCILKCVEINLVYRIKWSELTKRRIEKLKKLY